MATATTTVEGEIVLAGDLTGTGASPQLIATGVIPGTYAPVQRLIVDAKGRVVSIGKTTFAEIESLLPGVPLATTGSAGIVQIGRNIDVTVDASQNG